MQEARGTEGVVKVLLTLLVVGVAVGLGTFALNDWGYATFGFEGWIAVSSLGGTVVGLVFIGTWALVEAQR